MSLVGVLLFLASPAKHFTQDFIMCNILKCFSKASGGKYLVLGHQKTICAKLFSNFCFPFCCHGYKNSIWNIHLWVEVVKFYLQCFGRCLKRLLMDGQWIDKLRLQQSQKLTLICCVLCLTSHQQLRSYGDRATA